MLYLEERGYEVVCVASGEDALALCAAEHFDLFLLDERMPGVDGLTVLERLQGIRPDLPVVMITKEEDEGLMEEAIGRSIADFLTKPVNPSQVLSVCKRLLERERIRDEALARDYTSEFARITQRLSGAPLAPAEWGDLAEALAWWSLQLDETGQEGLGDSLASLQREADSVFARQVIDRYQEWVGEPAEWTDRSGRDLPPLPALPGRDLPPLPAQPAGADDRPLMTVDVPGAIVRPMLAHSPRMVLLVLDCLRYDQWLAIEPLVSARARVERVPVFSLLPSASPYSRNALLSGRYPDEIAAAYPDLVRDDRDAEESLNRFEPELMADVLALPFPGAEPGGNDTGPPAADPMPAGSAGLALFERVRSTADSEALARRLAPGAPEGLAVIVVSFLDLLVHDHAQSAVVQELAPDEEAFRALAREWFRHSPFPRLIRSLLEQDTPVVIATDHGSTRVSRPVEVKADRTATSGIRYKIGRNLNADPRWTHRIDDLSAWRLPPGRLTDTCLLAREDAFLLFAGDGGDQRRRLAGSFQHGGLSLAEVLVPLIRLTPLSASP